MSKKVLIRAYIHVHTKYIICRSLKIIFIVFKVLVYTSKNNTDYALKVHLYSLIKVDDLRKRYSIIDQHLARHFQYNVAGLLSLPPFLCSQIITPFSNSMVSANQKTGL